MKVLRTLLLLPALSTLAAGGDVTVRSRESGIRDGKPWGESYTEYHSGAGLRLDVTRDGESSAYMSFLFLRRPDRLYLVEGTSVRKLDLPLLESLEAKAATPAPGRAPVVTSLGSRHTVSGFPCGGFQLKRAGHPTRYLCLAPPESLGIPASLVADAAAMRDMLSRFMALASRPDGKSADTFNPYGLSEGFPVRIWETSGGNVTWEAQLLSISPGPVDPALFRAP